MRTECVHTNVVCALADVVATKLGIILLFLSFFLPSTYFSPRRGLPMIFACLSNGGEPPFTPQIVIPGWTTGGVRALWVSEQPPQHTHIQYIFKLHFFKLKQNEY